MAGGGADGSALGVADGVGTRAGVGGDGSVFLGDAGGLVDEVAGGGEGLGVELITEGIAACGVDGCVVGEGLLELWGFGDGAEVHEGDAVEVADAGGGEGGVEEVLDEVWIRSWGLGIRGRGEWWCGVGDGWLLGDPLRPLCGHLPRKRGGDECVCFGVEDGVRYKGGFGDGGHGAPLSWWKVSGGALGWCGVGRGIVIGFVGRASGWGWSDRI